MAQVWQCVEDDCRFWTTNPKEAGDHERKYNDGKLATRYTDPHFMDDLGD